LINAMSTPPEDFEELAEAALGLWDVPAGARVQLINLSENATFLITAPGRYRSIMRVHRQGYHTRRAIECELAWMRALANDGDVETPPTIAGIDNRIIQSFGTAKVAPRFLVMFAFLDGVEPSPDSDLAGPFRQLGILAAKTHLHSIGWDRPAPFERLVWDDAAVFGPAPTWGNWRDGPGVGTGAARAIRDILKVAEDCVRQRLAAFGRDPARFGLIHADMRLANLLVDQGRTRLIDFDDSGLGWFMYDFAAGISFMEDHAQVPALREAWLDGYRTIRHLDTADEREIDSFIILRRMALLAWIGSHAHTDLAREQAGNFAEVSAKLAENYLNKFA